MKALEVTDEQYEQLDALREALAEDVTYGHVRPRDAVQYLLDAHDDQDLDVAVDASTPSGDGDATEPDDGASESGGADEGDEAIDDADEGDEQSTETDEAVADGDDDAGGTPTPTPTPGGGSGDDKMSAMMNLLDTHDEKWERADSQETRYVVDLPDGSTEEAQTKDDVKAILFKNY